MPRHLLERFARPAPEVPPPVIRRRLVPRYRLNDLMRFPHPDLALVVVPPWTALCIECAPASSPVSQAFA